MTSIRFPLVFASKTRERCGLTGGGSMGLEILLGLAVLVVAIGSGIVVKDINITINIGNSSRD
ncbi:hypothetical protein [Aeromonas sp. 604534]|uniref:hypothetical protein n=1 Tax=Aeromonas sp. 604534 TaxID=2712055 RepID=UPI003BA20CEB